MYTCGWCRGRFSLVRNVQSKDGSKAKRVAKIAVYNSDKPADSLREYDMLKSVRQEHIVRLHEAYLFNDFVILVFEKLYGENVVRSLSLKNRYNEHTVSVIIKQVIQLDSGVYKEQETVCVWDSVNKPRASRRHNYLYIHLAGGTFSVISFRSAVFLP